MHRLSGEFSTIHVRSAAAGGSFEIQRDPAVLPVVAESHVAAIPEAENEGGYTVEEAIEHMGFGRWVFAMK